LTQNIPISKRVHHQNHNHVKLLYSLANRHQYLQLYHLLADKYFIDFDFGSPHKVSNTLKDYVSMKLEISEFDFYKYVTFNRIVYTIGDAIICIKRKSVNNETEFALINSIVYDSVNCLCYLIIEDLLTGPYLDHLTCYLVSENLDSVPKLFGLVVLFRVFFFIFLIKLKNTT
jgi:hypothetical protein